jgi:hypothetical protein
MVDKPDKTFQTTARQFKVFCRKVSGWKKKLGLSNWSIYVNHKDQEAEDGTPQSGTAYILYMYESSVAQINMSKTWELKFTDRLANAAAFHECFHLVMAPLMQLFELGDENVKLIAQDEEHKILATLERLLLFIGKRKDGDV